MSLFRTKEFTKYKLDKNPNLCIKWPKFIPSWHVAATWYILRTSTNFDDNIYMKILCTLGASVVKSPKENGKDNTGVGMHSENQN